MSSRKKVQFVTKTGAVVSFNKKPKQKSNKPKSAAQKRHLSRAKKAMTMYQSGQASTLKAAWAKV